MQPGEAVALSSGPARTARCGAGGRAGYCVAVPFGACAAGELDEPLFEGAEPMLLPDPDGVVSFEPERAARSREPGFRSCLLSWVARRSCIVR